MMKKSLAVILVLGILVILTGSVLSSLAPKANAAGPGTRGGSGSWPGPPQHPWANKPPEALEHPWGGVKDKPRQCIPSSYGDTCILSECRTCPTNPSVLTRLFFRLYVRCVVKQEMSAGSPTERVGK